MKNFVGTESVKLMDYHSSIDNIPEEQKEYLTELIHEVIYYETICFIKSLRKNKLMCLDDIVNIFGFKYQFVRKNIVNQPMFSRLDFADDIKKTLSYLEATENIQLFDCKL